MTMKYFISGSHTVVLLFVLLVLVACKPEYRIETFVGFVDGEAVTPTLKQETQELLTARITEAFGKQSMVETTDDGFRLVTRHTNQPTAELGKLIGYTGSAKMELYHLYRFNDPLIHAVADSIAWSDYRAEQNGGFMGESVVAGVEKYGALGQLLEYLNGHPATSKSIRFVSGKNNPSTPLKPGDIHYLIYAIRVPPNGLALLDNQAIEAADAGPTSYGQIAINISMDAKSAKIWEQMTTEAANDNNRQIAIMINDQVLTAPSVQTPITGGRTQISGDFSVEKAQVLAQQLSWKPLPLELKVVSQNLLEE